MFDKYAGHLPWCARIQAEKPSAPPDSDYWKCNCGLIRDVKNLQEKVQIYEKEFCADHH
jgi:hypothetical protein